MGKGVIMVQNYDSPCGKLLIGEYEGELCLCDWRGDNDRSFIDKKLQQLLNAEYKYGQSELLLMAKKQLDEYFNGCRKKIDIPIVMVGTEFQKIVWHELSNIPYGMTISYHELACRVGNPKAVRAVASANRVNPISIFVPCHRVIGKNGRLTGYGGGLSVKEFLLKVENVL